MPVPRDAPGAVLIDAAAVGGLACDGALSRAWRPRLGWGLLAAAVVIGAILGASGGVSALAWWPVALMPGAILLSIPAVAGLPVGVLYLAVLAGALAGGAVFAVAFAPGRRGS